MNKPRYDVLTEKQLPPLDPSLQHEWDHDTEYLEGKNWPPRDMPTEEDIKHPRQS